ncbi:FtsQ-type POTRA domain-containing protein [bacterium]|nr:FtsQ-type POTRA domain-containing protein [bacterium]
MTKNQKDKIDDLFYYSPINTEKTTQKEQKRKTKEREKRIKKQNSQKKVENQFDYDNEMVIKMTNKNNQRQEEKTKQKMSKKQRQILKKKKRIKLMLKFTALLIIIIAGIIFALVSPIFNIKEIDVSNNEQIKTETIVSLSQLNLGQNIFKFNKNKVNKNIKTNAYIESVEIKRKLPNKVQIQIEERKQEYNVEFLNGYAYINNQGYILQISEEKQALPTIQGISTPDEQIVEGNRLNSEDLEKLEVIIQIMNICKNYELDSKITNIDISTKDEYTLYLEEEKKTIYLGDKSNLSNKMLYVQVIIEENRGKEGEIFVNGDLNNNFKPRFKEKV